MDRIITSDGKRSKMKCILVFDHRNDIIFKKYNKKFAEHLNQVAKTQGLISDENVSAKLSANVIVQIFSPIVTSHRIMNCQFGNSYSSIQCQEDTNITFEDYMGYLFIYMSKDDVLTMAKFLSICVTIVRYSCGPNVLELKSDKEKTMLVSRLIDCWIYLSNQDQAVFVEAIEQLVVNGELMKITVQTLRESVDKLHCLSECTKIHGLLLVNNKFLGLYSSQHAKELGANDILYSILLTEISKTTKSEDSDDKEFVSLSSSPGEIQDLHTYEVLLSGCDPTPRCFPYIIHVHQIYENINLLFFIETGNVAVAANLYDSFLHLHNIQLIQIQRNADALKPVFANLDTAVKRLCDSLKKLKSNSLKAPTEELSKTWDFMRRKYQEFLKNQCADSLLRAESLTGELLETLKELLALTRCDRRLLDASRKYLNEASKIVVEKLSDFDEFLKVKAMKNYSLGSTASLTINKYLEEFPGLVHFIYIDRTNHRITAPGIDFRNEETIKVTKNKIWSMMQYARLHLSEGNLSIMWKDYTFSYAYFLWFEDVSGSPLKPTVYPINFNKPLPKPGIFCDDFYRKLKEACFPKMPAHKIRCYELYCVHLGLATTQCVLEHTRRLSATIWELKGHPDHPIDLL